MRIYKRYRRHFSRHFSHQITKTINYMRIGNQRFVAQYDNELEYQFVFFFYKIKQRSYILFLIISIYA